MKGTTKERMERERRKRSSSGGSEKMERVGDRGNGRILFQRYRSLTKEYD
jgi:hypothetical protein